MFLLRIPIAVSAASDGKKIRTITLGTVDGDPGLRPEYHMYVSGKAPWYEISDSLPQYDLRSPYTKPPATREDE